jgi:hypothetical protein
MKFTKTQIFLNIPPLGVLILLSFVFVACSPKQIESQTNARPACVTLSGYSGAIQQVMQVEPSWEPTSQEAEEFQYQWKIQDEEADHTLNVLLSPDGCVCGTNAKSFFNGDYTQGKLAGLLQGAAVAPVSELDYTAEWLEPRLLKQCQIALLLHNSYQDETSMANGTTWELICSRQNSIDRKLMTSLTILTPMCADAFD